MRKILLCLIYLINNPLIAHPHAFLDMKTHILIEGNKLQGFTMNWTLDELTSAELIYQIKRSNNQTLEKQKITDELSLRAIQAHYFSELYDQNQTPIKFKARPRNPGIEIKNHQVSYYFDLILSTPQPLTGRSFNLFTFEPSYYLYMGYANTNHVTISEQQYCKVAMQEPNINQSIQLYASQLDEDETPDLEMENGLSLGAQFAQKVEIICQ